MYIYIYTCMYNMFIYYMCVCVCISEHKSSQSEVANCCKWSFQTSSDLNMDPKSATPL